MVLPELVVTNRNWKVCESPITYSSIYGGEDYDARKYQSSWMNPGFNDDLWTAPVITKTEMELKVQTSAPLTVRDQLPVVRKYQNSKGNWIFDFGQNFSGIVRLKVRGYGGHKVTMKPGELLEKDSTVNQRASGVLLFLELHIEWKRCRRMASAVYLLWIRMLKYLVLKSLS